MFSFALVKGGKYVKLKVRKIDENGFIEREEGIRRETWDKVKEQWVINLFYNKLD